MRQGDPLSPLLFALALDALSAMFHHALKSKVLIGAQLSQIESISHLQYADNLIIFSLGDQEDLQIIKLILYLFEGCSGLSIIYSKSCLYCCFNVSIKLVQELSSNYLPRSSNFWKKTKETRTGETNWLNSVQAHALESNLPLLRRKTDTLKFSSFHNASLLDVSL